MILKAKVEEDKEPMDFDDIVFDDSPSSSDECYSAFR